MLYRLTEGPRAGMTGRVVRWYADKVELALTCQPGIKVSVPRSWIEPVDLTPQTAAEARGQAA